MKHILIICSMALCLVGCDRPTKPKANMETLILNENIKKAQSKGDYKLYATSGRRLVFPGIDSTQFDAVLKRCGKKYMPNTGDVIKSEAEKALRAKNFQYMVLFNQRMIVDCFNQIDDEFK